MWKKGVVLMMLAGNIQELLAGWIGAAAENFVPEDKALEPGLGAMRIFDAPLVGVCGADDSYLLSLTDSDEANLSIMPPGEWLPGARSVISVYFPLSKRVRESNRGKGPVSLEWLHGRIEGQGCVEAATRYLLEVIENIPAEGAGADDGANNSARAVAPSLDERFQITKLDGGSPTRRYRVNWSERHAAYAAGLGTFAMPGGIITRVGAAGRLGSVITTLDIPPTPRAYDGIYDYCIRCGACALRCPAGAIGANMAKNAELCSAQLNLPTEKYPPYYGCGKCQVAVPCESAIPCAPAAQEAV